MERILPVFFFTQKRIKAYTPTLSNNREQKQNTFAGAGERWTPYYNMSKEGSVVMRGFLPIFEIPFE
jgi:hypothetical protein